MSEFITFILIDSQDTGNSFYRKVWEDVLFLLRNLESGISKLDANLSCKDGNFIAWSKEAEDL